MKKLQILPFAVTTLVATLAASACSDDESTDNSGNAVHPTAMPSDDEPSPSTEPTETEPGEDAEAPAPTGCPDVADRDIVDVDSSITEDTTWTCDKIYELADLTFVEDESTLTIEAGTLVRGFDRTALVVTAGAKLVAKGTQDQPVVMTSASDEPQPGDWGGVVMLGNASINISGGTSHIEGIASTEDRGLYGGGETPDDTSDCGQLKYVRVEYAGFLLSMDNELNGISIAGCGSKTTLDYVQVHAGSDDGIEIWGGAPKLSHIVLTGNQDDSLDWDAGFKGQVQFLVIQHHSDGQFSADSNGIEADNLKASNDALPRSNPTIANATIIGAGAGASDLYGLTLRRGTAATITNSIVMNFGKGAINVVDAATVQQALDGELGVTHTMFYENLDGNDAQFRIEEDADIDDQIEGADPFIEVDFFSDSSAKNVFDEDPELGDPTDTENPDFAPSDDSAAADGAGDPGAGFEEADYLGAIEPGGEDWTQGWTAYPPVN